MQFLTHLSKLSVLRWLTTIGLFVAMLFATSEVLARDAVTPYQSPFDGYQSFITHEAHKDWQSLGASILDSGKPISGMNHSQMTGEAHEHGAHHHGTSESVTPTAGHHDHTHSISAGESHED